MIYHKMIDTMGLPFTLIYSALILACMYYIFISIPKAFKSKSWPTTAGVITRSILRERRRTGKKGGAVTLFEADIEYTYTIDTKQYSSRKIKWLEHRSNNKNYHQKILDRYLYDQSVTVFYNPKRSSFALLEPGLSSGNFIGFIFFSLSLLSMSFILFEKM